MRKGDRPGVCVAIVGKNGTVIRCDPDAWWREERDKFEKARRAWREKEAQEEE